MNKRKLHHTLVVLRQVKTWQLLIALVVLAAMAAYFLRQNSLQMIELRNLVMQADEQNKDIPAALNNLQRYIATHMNTSMGDRGIYLEHSYQRAYNAAVQKAAQSGSASAVAYQQADKDCRDLFSKTSSFPAYIQCVTDKVAATGSAADPVAAIKAPSADLYRFNYESPTWSPDVAGLTLLAACFVAAILGLRLVLLWVVYALLRWRRQVS